MKIELIEWVDAITSDPWVSLDDAFEPMSCFTTGFILKETPDYIVLAGTYGVQDGDNQVCSRIAIPTGWIKKREVIHFDTTISAH